MTAYSFLTVSPSPPFPNSRTTPSLSLTSEGEYLFPQYAI
ncbi:8199_t:CDS:2 [Acaulospora morrowiae]|uniref:8199_t:CDS:1 n=1 Tax=Acaulospora morrowiae TaxID=94023 RepID=A0A9N8YPF7_9GLOM|nr:8199_t:CDS:2 [Acaulospora morrowiae]